jgi:hypothetical protein
LNALNSEWVQREIKHAQSLQKKIIPLMRPGIGPAILRLIFGEEPVGIPLGDGPSAVQDTLPNILAAVGLQLPTETINRIVAQSAPVSDLVLELRSPSMGERGGVRRAAATATLTYSPADGSPEVQSQEYGFTAPNRSRRNRLVSGALHQLACRTV